MALMETPNSQRFDFPDRCFVEEFVHYTMFRIATSLWVLASSFLLYLFRLIARFIVRLEEAYESSRNNDSEEEDEIAGADSKVLEPEGFHFHPRTGEKENAGFLENSPKPSTSKYQITPFKDLSGFIEEPKTISFTVHQLFVGSNDSPIFDFGNNEAPVSVHQEFLASSDDDDFQGFDSEAEAVVLGRTEDSVEISCTENTLEKPEQAVPIQAEVGLFSLNRELSVSSDDDDFQGFDSEAEAVVLGRTEDSVEISCTENTLEKPEQAVPIEAEVGLFSLNRELSVSSDDGFGGDDQMVNRAPGDEDFPEFDSEAEAVALEKTEEPVEISCREDVEQAIPTETEDGLLSDNQSLLLDAEIEFRNSVEMASLEVPNPSPPEEKEVEFSEKIPNSDEFGDTRIVSTDEEYIDFEPNLQFSSHHDENFLREELLHEQDNLQRIETEPVDSFEGFKEPNFQKKNSWASDWKDDDYDDEFDILLKHQDLIEQMKMEIKNARAKALPTILEECETPKMAEDLKPLKIDEKFEHKDFMEEIQKVYKSYSEKMRKLDILNYQTLHAISFLQWKDPAQQPGQRSSVSAVKSVLFPSLWPCKLRRIYADPTLKSITELQRKLEVVYVGQACLSWEILHWQYEKATELLEHDPEGDRPYSQVAGEFQQFQVLVQRFVENEPFQGPRVQNYVKNRCELRTLLQIPALRDDCLKDAGVDGETMVSIAMMAEIIDESMRVFWEFLRSDRDESNLIFKAFQATHVDLRNPSDSQLLIDIKTSLQKKEKRLKDILRSGNCIVKKFQKHPEEKRIDREQLIAQIELKLVARVLSLSRLTTDQLVWCQKRLRKINFFSRKVHVESSFLLFPFQDF